MWRKVSKWYQDWEDQQIAVLEKPELASQAAQGYRRFYYCKLAERSPVEREQLRDFSVALKGWRGWLWTAALLGFFSLCGPVLRGSRHCPATLYGWPGQAGER